MNPFNMAERINRRTKSTFGFCILIGLLSVKVLLAQSPVWKVSRGEDSFYLGGTCHLLRATDYPLPQAFEQGYKEADRLAFEVSPKEMQEPSAAGRMMQAGVYAENKSLQDVLSPEVYAALAEQGEKRSLPIVMLKNFKPGIAVMMLTMQELVRKGISVEGVDLYYSNRATEDGKPTEGLETIDFQIDLLCNMGAGYENEFVRYSLEDLNKLNEMIDPLLDAWRVGDTNEMETLFLKDMKRYPKLYHDLLVARNQRWLPRFEEFLETEETELVLVGFGHLVGDDGLIYLLRQLNCTVECLPAKSTEEGI
jgi:uncharacterized protein YbaP (TraB family)